MDITQQKTITDSIITKLETIDPHAILAGGAPRDWWHNREADDLDFYIHLTDLSIADLHKQLFELGLLKNCLYPCDLCIAENYLETSAIRWVVSVVYEGQKVQIVVMHRPVSESVLQHFSLSVCYISYKNGTLYPTPEFMMTIEEKIIRQLQPAFGSGYIDKIKAKFPDYDFVGLSQDIEDFEF